MNKLHLWFSRTHPLFENPSPLFVLTIILFVGFLCSYISKKTKIPTITSQIIGGIVIGKYVLNLFDHHTFDEFTSITSFALGFIGLIIGGHFDLKKIKSATKRILFITLSDVLITPVLLFSALFYVGKLDFTPSVILATLGLATAPGAIIHIVKEKKTKGILTKTLLSVIALNNIITIVVFYIFYSYISGENISVMHAIFDSIFILVESISLGFLTGAGLIYLTEKRNSNISYLILVFLSVIMTVGISKTFGFSGILSSLFLGMYLANFSKEKTEIFSAFEDIEKEVFMIFFVLAGTHLDFLAIKNAKYLGLLFIITRLFSKTFASTLGAYLGNATETIKKGIKFSMYPIAGIAIGMLFISKNIPGIDQYFAEIQAILLSTIVVYEIFGPIMTEYSLRKVGEINQDRLRLMDFIQEEYIKIDLESTSKIEVLDELAGFLHTSHRMTDVSVEELKKSLEKREKTISTGIGGNLAIPHAIINGEENILGVIGVSKKGIEFDSLDGKPVNIFFLIATPQDKYEYHLQVLANIAKMFGHHPQIKNKIINSSSSEKVFEIFQHEDIAQLNPFFEDFDK